MERLLASLAWLLVVTGSLFHDFGATVGIPAVREWMHYPLAIMGYSRGARLRWWSHVLATLPVTLPLVMVGIVCCGVGVTLQLLADHLD